jgi:deazaflavin-dependent oxidoreductase (nitroreductase family)
MRWVDIWHPFVERDPQLDGKGISDYRSGSMATQPRLQVRGWARRGKKGKHPMSSNSDSEPVKYIDPATGTDELQALPDGVQAELDAHKQQYLSDPVAAHMWDPVVIGVPGGPVKCLLLTYTGRKSGRTLHTALQYYTLNGQIAIVGSRGGTAEHPVWYLNLLDKPRCHIQVGAEGRDAVARTVAGAERAEWWAAISTEQPVQLEYQARTTREIPIIVMD